MAAAVPPSIVSGPTARTANPGDAVAFTVVASGDPVLRYQWTKGGHDIPLATEPTLTLRSVTAADADGDPLRFSLEVSADAGNMKADRPVMAAPMR